MERQNFKLSKNDSFLSATLLESIIKETDIKKATIEEGNSELWFETLHGKGKIVFKNNLIYNGSLKYGILHSESQETPSTITFPNGTTYTGTILNNEITGTGTYTFPKGSTYTGGVGNGLRHGHGIFTSSNGIIYDGEWKQGLKHGKGKITQGNMILEGEWKNGHISGQAVIKWKSGNCFEGTVLDNKMHGNGYMIWYNNNEKFTGQWLNNGQNGIGIHIWYEPKGDFKFLRERYVGQWQNGMRNGYGRFFYANGNGYEGYWKNNHKDGFGILTSADTTKGIGNFKNDILVENLTSLNLAISKRQKELESGAQKSKQSNSSVSQAPNRNSIRINTKRVSKNYVISPDSANTSSSNVSTNLAVSSLVILNNPSLPSQNTKPLGAIKEADENENPSLPNKENEKKSIVEQTQQPDKKTLAFRAKIEKAINDIKIPIDISDLIEIDPEIKSCLKEIDNVLLRNLSFITHIYMYACGKETIKDADGQASTISPSVTNETKSQFNNFQSNKIEDDKEKNETVIEYNNIYNNDGYYCLDFEGVWKGLRETGFLSADFSIATLNRLYYQNPNNYIEMFYLPEEYLDTDTEDAYDYLYDNINYYRKQFVSQYKEQLSYNAFMADDTEKKYLEDHDSASRGGYKGKDIHDSKNVILLRYFYEMMIRIAYGKYNNLTGVTLDKKMKMGFTVLKQFFKIKKRSLENSLSTITVLDIKLKNFEPAGDGFKKDYCLKLKEIFNKIYTSSVSGNSHYNHADQTFTYRYFYQNVILKCEKLGKMFEDKTKFMQGITIYHKDKMNFNQPPNLIAGVNSLKQTSLGSGSNTNIAVSNDVISNIDPVVNVERLFDIEIIFYEFLELVFFISKKYFVFYKRKDDDYQEVIELICKSMNLNATEIKTGKGRIVYPKLKKHLDIEKIKGEENERKQEKERLQIEFERFINERKEMVANDVNNHKQEEEKHYEENSESDFGYD